MQFRARRAGGVILLAALAACATMTVDARAAHRHVTHATARAARHRGPKGVVYARSAIVVDPATDSVLYQKNADTEAPIASLTKLMTAMVFLEQNPDLRRVVEVTRAELSGGGHTRLRNHEKLALGDLLHMSLMSSDNVATRVLARESGLAPDAFVARMNAKAKGLGLQHTHYVEVTGLDERNVSTASDLAHMVRVAADNVVVRDITTTQEYVFVAGRRTHHLVNTNRLLRGRYEVNCGKTGFISESGYCLATWIRARGRDLIAVVLGAPTNATRFADVMRLVQHTTATGLDSRQ
jgi:D-alanyl-D-alanine endopeptidase (penicillin-binding protein 7)